MSRPDKRMKSEFGEEKQFGILREEGTGQLRACGFTRVNISSHGLDMVYMFCLFLIFVNACSLLYTINMYQSVNGTTVLVFFSCIIYNQIHDHIL